VDRAVLQQLLAQGLSLAEIGRRLDRHEATVAYWLRKHGLQAANRAQHAARGALRREQLEEFVEEGLSIGQIAERVGRSRSTVRHWLREYELATVWAGRRAASAAGTRGLVLSCARHGEVPFVRRATGGYRCSRCRAEAVAKRRRKVKQVLVAEAGGACALCGYDRCVAALHFHHREPERKRFALSVRGVTRSLDAARAEARKCVLLCSNCHAEVEMGVTAVPGAGPGRVQ
jgi:transposase